jgi:cardiolipin synthase
LAKVELIPWYLAIAVIARDLIIVSGAACYHWMIGPFELAATGLSKSNMFIQIVFCVLVLLSQVVTTMPEELIAIGAMAVLTIAAASGLDYVWSWTKRALSSEKTAQKTSPKAP